MVAPSQHDSRDAVVYCLNLRFVLFVNAVLYAKNDDLFDSMLCRPKESTTGIREGLLFSASTGHSGKLQPEANMLGSPRR